MNKKKLEQLLQKVNALPNEQASQYIESIDRLITFSSQYTTAAAKFNWAFDLAKYDDQHEAKPQLAQLEKKLDVLYSYLSTTIQEVNQICVNVGMEKIYLGNSKEKEKAEFAKKLTEEYFANRR